MNVCVCMCACVCARFLLFLCVCACVCVRALCVCELCALRVLSRGLVGVGSPRGGGRGYALHHTSDVHRQNPAPNLAGPRKGPTQGQLRRMRACGEAAGARWRRGPKQARLLVRPVVKAEPGRAEWPQPSQAGCPSRPPDGVDRDGPGSPPPAYTRNTLLYPHREGALDHFDLHCQGQQGPLTHPAWLG